jgi:hypothetical protein
MPRTKRPFGAKIEPALYERLLAPFGGVTADGSPREHGAMARAFRRLVELGIESGEFPDPALRQPAEADDPAVA